MSLPHSSGSGNNSTHINMWVVWSLLIFRNLAALSYLKIRWCIRLIKYGNYRKTSSNAVPTIPNIPMWKHVQSISLNVNCGALKSIHWILSFLGKRWKSTSLHLSYYNPFILEDFIHIYKIWSYPSISSQHIPFPTSWLFIQPTRSLMPTCAWLWAILWNIGKLAVRTPSKDNDSSSPSFYQLPIAPREEVQSA